MSHLMLRLTSTNHLSDHLQCNGLTLMCWLWNLKVLGIWDRNSDLWDDEFTDQADLRWGLYIYFYPEQLRIYWAHRGNIVPKTSKNHGTSCSRSVRDSNRERSLPFVNLPLKLTRLQLCLLRLHQICILKFICIHGASILKLWTSSASDPDYCIAWNYFISHSDKKTQTLLKNQTSDISDFPKRKDVNSSKESLCE